jgi:hypothetical protein
MTSKSILLRRIMFAGYLILGGLLVSGCFQLGSRISATKTGPSLATMPNITGKILSKSDVFLQPDRPLSKIVVLVISESNFEDLLHESSTQSGSMPIIDNELHGKYVTTSTVSMQDGSYNLQLPQGNYYFCLANIGRNITLPAYVNGCVEVSISEEHQENIDVYWGEGGVTLK